MIVFKESATQRRAAVQLIHLLDHSNNSNVLIETLCALDT